MFSVTESIQLLNRFKVVMPEVFVSKTNKQTPTVVHLSVIIPEEFWWSVQWENISTRHVGF